MKQYVITISRQFGSLGRTIGKQLAKELGIAYYDRELLEAAVEVLGEDYYELEQFDEKIKNPFVKSLYPMGLRSTLLQTKVFELQKARILEIADKESCIIVGRCADYILKDRKNVLKVFIYAPYEERLTNSILRLKLSDEEARHMIESVDKARKNYHEFYTNTPFEGVECHDIMVNSSLLGVKGTVKMLKEIVNSKFC